jgi:antitoxin HicB
MYYPVIIEKSGDSSFFVSFPDIPEALTQGETLEDALAMAKDALETALEFYFEDARTVPLPSKPEKDQLVVELNPSLWAKVLLLNEMVVQNIRPADLARKLSVHPQEVTRIMNLKHATKIDTISSAFNAMGKTLEFVVSNSA